MAKKKKKMADLLRFFSFYVFLAIIELVQELLISNMHNQFEEDTYNFLVKCIFYW